MNELLPININDKQEQTVSARALHEFLGMTERFNKWFEKQLEYDFHADCDFTSVKTFTLVNNGAKRELDDYDIKIDMAKEICMLAKNERGKQARQYFIQLEKDWNSPEKTMARALLMADKKIKALYATNEKQAAQIEDQKPKVLFAESVAVSKGTMLVRELAKLITQNGYEIGERRLHQWLRDNGYLIKKQGKDYGKPTQKAMQKALFEISETTINHNSGTITTKTTARVTGKGQIYFLNKFKEMLAKVKAELIDFGDAKALREGAAQ